MTEAVWTKAYVAVLGLCVALAGWSVSGPTLAAPRVALVIGNAAYAHAPALANPLNDAADVGAALERLGFEVRRVANAGQAELRRGLQEFARAASASEVAVVFYAGHGIEVDQRNFLVPVDARLASDQDVEFEAVPLELVSQAVARASGLRLVILDACRKNPFAVSMQRAGSTRSIGRGLARVEPSGETLVAYAAKEGTVAADGAGRNSPFSEALLRHLEEPGLEVGLMFRKVRDAVLAATGGRQEPFVYGSLSSRGVYLASRPANLQRPGEAAQSPAADNPGSQRVAAERELLFWESVKDSGHAADLQAYLDRYPGGAYEALARNRLGRLGDGPAESGPTELSVTAAPGRDASSVPAPVEAKFWAMVEGSDVASDLEAYLEHYPDGVYAPLARLRLAQLERERSAPPSASGSADVTASGDSPVAVAAPGASASSLAPEATEASLGLERVERRRIQLGLSSLGYGPGPVDGLFGTRTREAIRRYQAAKGFEATGYLTADEAQALVALGEEAVRAADDAAFSRAKELNTVAGYEAYLARGGRHEAEARRLLALVPQPKEVGEVFRDCAECPELVVVPSGSFVMGSPESEAGRYSDEGPLHRVEIGGAFAVGVHEVTFREWDACRRAGGCSHNPGDRGWGRGSRPVIHVSWADAKEYVRWLSRETGERYRLLSEAQWEYVARAGTRTRFHWGGQVGRGRANCVDCGSGWDDESTEPVGSFPANAFGLHDVHGNVWEWVEDCAHGSYVGAPGDGSAWTAGGDCGKRVLRGGSWLSEPRHVRSAIRGRGGTGDRSDRVGFRVARTLD